MIRYVAIGAVVGFLLSVFLLSRREAPPIEPPPPAPAPAARMFEAPPGIRRHADLRIPDGLQRRGPTLLQQQVDALALDGGP